MAFKLNWNESTIRQFYATLEVNMEKEFLVWMMGKKRIRASFKDLAQVSGFSYRGVKAGRIVMSIPVMQSHARFFLSAEIHGNFRNFLSIHRVR